MSVKGVGRKTREAISWSAATAIASNFVRIAVLAALGRLLEPGDFGIVAAAMTVIMLAGLLKDFGLGLALVQRDTLEREHVEVAFTVSVIQGIVLTVAIVALAGPIADFFEMEASTDVVRALAGLFILRSLALVPNFVMQREMRFRALALIDFVGYVAGSVTSIALALADAGPWALVGGYGVETGLQVCALVASAPPPRRLRWHPRHLRELLGFGIGRSLANLGNYFAMQGDYMVVGRMLDKTQLGLYQRAYELVRFPSHVFSSVAGAVLFSAFSKVQNDPERMGRVFRRTTFACAVVLMPATAGLFVLAPEVIRILLGDQWDGAVWPFRIMTLAMMSRTTYKLGGLVGRSSGEVFTLAKLQFLYATLVIGGAAISVQWGILGVACTTTFAVTVHWILMYWIGLRVTNLKAWDIVAAHGAPAAITVAVGAVAWVTATALRGIDAHHAVVAVVATVAGSAVWAGAMFAGIRRGAGDWPWLAETVRDIVTGKAKKEKAARKAQKRKAREDAELSNRDSD